MARCRAARGRQSCRHHSQRGHLDRWRQRRRKAQREQSHLSGGLGVRKRTLNEETSTGGKKIKQGKKGQRRKAEEIEKKDEPAASRVRRSEQ